LRLEPIMNLELLRRRVDRVFGGAEPDTALNRVRDIVGSTNLPATFEGELGK